MAAGESIVGSILGYLRLDADQFHREIEKAIVEADVLDGKDVDIKVDVHAAKANAELDKVAAKSSLAGKNVSQMGGSFSRIPGGAPVLIGGIAAAVALLGPVAGSAAASIGGLTGVLGAGILAWKGYQNEVEKGTALGLMIKGQVDGLSGSLTGLEATASRAMSHGLLSGMARVNAFLPTINGNVRTLGRNLGTAFDISAQGLISGLRTSMPLLQDGGRYATILAQKFADFAQSKDFKDFIGYAREELPKVGTALGSLTSGLIDMGVALAPAGDAVVAFIDQTGKALSLTSKAVGPVVDGVKWLGTHGIGTGTWEKQQKAAAAAAEAVKGNTNAVALMNPVIYQQSRLFGTNVTTLQAVRDAQAQAATAADIATVKMQQENDAAGLLKQSLDLLNGESLDAASAQNAFDSSLVNMGDHVTATGKKVHFTTRNINNMSSASVALRGQLNSQVQNLERVVEANGGLSDSTGKARDQMKRMRQQIIDNAVAHGVDRDAVTKYIDSLLKIPKKVPPTRLDVEKAEAEKKAKQLKRAIDSIPAAKATYIAERGSVPARIRIMELQDAIDRLKGKTVTVTARITTGKFAGKALPIGSANGNIFPSVRPFASGGFENHVAQISPAGAMRLWAEPETGGEAYIPLAPSKRARSMAIWEETGRRLGAGGGVPAVYVQNPFTGEYLLAQAAGVADQRIAAHAGSVGRSVASRPR